MVVNSMVSGNLMTCMAMVFTSTQMELGMTVIIRMIKKKATVFTYGLMDVGTKDGGTKENNMVLGHILIQLKELKGLDSGNMASV